MCRRAIVGTAVFLCSLNIGKLICDRNAKSEPSAGGLAVTRVVGVTYPRLAQLTGVQGIVVLVGTVSREGTVVSVRVSRGPGVLALAAKEALSKWRFTGCSDTVATCDIEVGFSFVLSDQCDISNCPTEFQADLPNKVQIRSRFARAIVD